MMIFVFSSFLLTVYGQQKTVTGTVKGAEDGLAVIGATVQVKGSTTGTATDVDGKYQIVVPEGATLVFRYVGMKNAEVVVGTSNVIDVTMNYDLLGVDEVVVVAYGVTKKESYTGSASVVKSGSLAKTPTTSIGKALQANASGVQVVNTSGSSTAEPTIRIRGIGSITASQIVFKSITVDMRHHAIMTFFIPFRAPWNKKDDLFKYISLRRFRPIKLC